MGDGKKAENAADRPIMRVCAIGQKVRDSGRADTRIAEWSDM